MKSKVKFLRTLRNLLFSWGGDTPREAYWTANELLEWLESEFDIQLEFKFEYDSDKHEWNSQQVFEQLETQL